MPAKEVNPFFDHYQHLRTFKDHILRDLARNEAAPRDYRKFATELLLARRSPYAAHTDLQGFVQELNAEMEGIQFEHPAPEPVPVENPGPLKSSVTTATMFGQEVIDNTVQIMEETGPEIRTKVVDLDEVSTPLFLEEPAAVPTEIQPTLPTESAHAKVPAKRKPKDKDDSSG